MPNQFSEEISHTAYDKITFLIFAGGIFYIAANVLSIALNDLINGRNIQYAAFPVFLLFFAIYACIYLPYILTCNMVTKISNGMLIVKVPGFMRDLNLPIHEIEYAEKIDNTIPFRFRRGWHQRRWLCNVIRKILYGHSAYYLSLRGISRDIGVKLYLKNGKQVTIQSDIPDQLIAALGTRAK